MEGDIKRHKNTKVILTFIKTLDKIMNFVLCNLLYADIGYTLYTKLTTENLFILLRIMGHN